VIRLVRQPFSLFSIAVLVLSIPIWTRMFWPPAAVVAAAAQGQGGEVDLPVVLIRAGLDPKALAAAGVSSGSIASLVQAANTTAGEQASALAAADATYASNRASGDRLQRLIQSGRGSGEDVQSYQAAVSARDTASTQRDTAIAAVITGATAGLTSGQRATLATIRANRSWNLPLEFLVVNREQSEWVALRDALANERIAGKLGEEPDAAAQTQLATWRANGSVAAARTALDTNLASVTTAWNNTTD
jgi:hypothetical protein